MNRELLNAMLHEAIVSGGNLVAEKGGYKLAIRNRCIVIFDETDTLVHVEETDSDILGCASHATLAQAGFAPSISLIPPLDDIRGEIEEAIVWSSATILDVVVFAPDGRLFWRAVVSGDESGVVVTLYNSDTGGVLDEWGFTPPGMPALWWRNAMYNAGLIEW